MVLIGVVALGYEVWVHGTTPLLAAVRFEVRLADQARTAHVGRPVAVLIDGSVVIAPGSQVSDYRLGGDQR